MRPAFWFALGFAVWGWIGLIWEETRLSAVVSYSMAIFIGFLLIDDEQRRTTKPAIRERLRIVKGGDGN